MAIDTAEKRRSVSGIVSVPFIPGVTANSSKDAEWRQQSGWNYSGITTGAGVSVSGLYYYLILLAGRTK